MVFLNQPFSLFEDINHHEFLGRVFDYASTGSAHCVVIHSFTVLAWRAVSSNVYLCCLRVVCRVHLLFAWSLSLPVIDKPVIDTAHWEFLTPETTILNYDLILLKKLRSTSVATSRDKSHDEGKIDPLRDKKGETQKRGKSRGKLFSMGFFVGFLSSRRLSTLFLDYFFYLT